MIILAGTPIGNLQDASPRLREALASIEVMAVEDTRVARHLMAGLGIEAHPELLVMEDHRERARVDEIVERARETDVLVMTDAGMPAISDPGYRLVAAAHAAGVQVTAIPGPSAVVTALALAGIPTDRFSFEGFAPRKPAERARVFDALAADQRTLVFYESPNRLADTLDAMVAAFGPDRLAAVARELTKRFEDVVRAPLGELADLVTARGEIVIVVAGALRAAPALADAVAEAEALIGEGLRTKAACAHVARFRGVSRNELYAALLAAKSEHD